MPPRVKHLASDKDVRSLALGEFPITQGIPRPIRQLAEICTYDERNNSYVVRTCGVGGDPKFPAGQEYRGVSCIRENPTVIAPLPEGTMVILDHSVGIPLIAGTVNLRTFLTDVENPINTPIPVGGKSGEGVSSASPPDSSVDNNALIGYYRQPRVPLDVIPGEVLHASKDGNFIGALRNGYNVMQGGPSGKSKIEVFGSHDLIRQSCSDYELFTDFGVLEIFNGEGRCGLSFKGGADQLTESGGNESQWTFQLDIGDTGDFFDMRILNADGKIKSRVHISADGQLEILACNGLSLVNGGGGPFVEESATDVIQKFLKKITQTISGAATFTFEGTRSTSVAESDKTIVGFNQSEVVNNNKTTFVGNVQQATFMGGNPALAKPTNVAVETQVLNGSYVLELGKLPANPLAQAGCIIAVNNGAVTLGQNPLVTALPAIMACVNLNTTLPGSVALGGTSPLMAANPATSPSNMAMLHAVMYEPLLTVINALALALDTHVHVPPLNPPSGPSPAVPVTPIVAPLMFSVMSQRVLIGG